MTTRKPKPPPAKRGAKKKIEVDPTLAPRIQTCLERGLTHKMTCAECGIIPDTFYRYIREIPDFSDMVSRAETVALAKAVKAFATGLQEQKINHTEIKTYKQTRLRRTVDEEGNVIEVPYTYTEETNTGKLIVTPPDWRAGESWLKRRDRENWSEKALELNININVEIVAKLVKALEAAGEDPNSVFQRMMDKIAQTPKVDA
jgi:hypothetical protein